MNINMLIKKVTELGNADKEPLFTSKSQYRDGYMSALHDVERMAEECAEVIYPNNAKDRANDGDTFVWQGIKITTGMRQICGDGYMAMEPTVTMSRASFDIIKDVVEKLQDMLSRPEYYGEKFSDILNNAMQEKAAEVKGELCEAEGLKPYPVTLALGMAFDHLDEHPKNSLTIEMEPGSMHIDLYPQKEE